MGWLELLPLLKRLVPLLTRVAPLLEGFVATRGIVREDLQSSLNDFKTKVTQDLAATAVRHGELADALTANTERLGHLSSDLARLQARVDEQTSKMSSVETQVHAFAGMLRLATVLLGILLILCILIVYLVLTRHV